MKLGSCSSRCRSSSSSSSSSSGPFAIVSAEPPDRKEVQCRTIEVRSSGSSAGRSSSTMRSSWHKSFLRPRVPPVGTAMELEGARITKKYPRKVVSRCAVGPPVGTATDQQITDEHSVGVARRNVASSTAVLLASRTKLLGRMRKQ